MVVPIKIALLVPRLIICNLIIHARLAALPAISNKLHQLESALVAILRVRIALDFLPLTAHLALHP